LKQKSHLFSITIFTKTASFTHQRSRDRSFTDEAVENGTLYTYKISAVFSGTYSGEIFSFPAQAMPCVPFSLPYSIDFESGYAGMDDKNDLLTGWIER
jgi:hypothetical protein